MSAAAAMRLLANQLRTLEEEPVEGFTVRADESNIFRWDVWIEGPSDTAYAGGVFKLRLEFPQDFPLNPPQLFFVSDFWHPNVYPDGKVCISILHPPGVDEMSGEDPAERWLPTRSIETIILSVIMLLSCPNFSSPANIDASVELRKEPEKFKRRVRALVEKALREKPADVKIPHPDTDPLERAAQKMKKKNVELLSSLDESFVFDDDDDEDFIDDDDE